MGEVKISGPVAAGAIIIVVVILVLVGNHFSSPPQRLGPVAQSMMDNIHRAQSQGQAPSGQPR
jgi:hypothetical protein